MWRQNWPISPNLTVDNLTEFTIVQGQKYRFFFPEKVGALLTNLFSDKTVFFSGFSEKKQFFFFPGKV